MVAGRGADEEKDHAQEDQHVDLRASGVDADYLLETFLENTPDHMYIKDVDGRFTQLSASLGTLDGPRRPASARWA